MGTIKKLDVDRLDKYIDFQILFSFIIVKKVSLNLLSLFGSNIINMAYLNRYCKCIKGFHRR